MTYNKQNVYTATVAFCGIAVFLLCCMQARADFFAYHTAQQALQYCLMLICLMTACRLLPIHIAVDKTMDVSFVPVLACVMTGGASIAVVLFSISALIFVTMDPVTKRYYYPLFKRPLVELFNIGNVVLAIFIAGLVLRLFPKPTSIASPLALGLAVLFSAINIVLNLLFFILYYRLGERGKFLTLMQQNLRGLVPNILCTVPFGLVLGLVLQSEKGYFGIILFFAPLLLARYSFKLYLDSKSMHLRTIESLSKAIDVKDHYTQGHSSRVAYISKMIAHAVNPSASFSESIETAALLHDVGKIGIDDAILNKAGPLTPEERTVIEEHPFTGYKIIESIHFSKTITDAVLYHHYRYDTKGYPQTPVPEPAGKQPLSAAILAVADTYDAMTSDRPYRKGLSHEAAMAELLRASGTQLNPEIVDIFIRIAPQLTMGHISESSS